MIIGMETGGGAGTVDGLLVKGEWVQTWKVCRQNCKMAAYSE